MATFEGVGSFSIADFDAELRTMQYLHDSKVRQFQAAANRAHETALQTRAQQAAAQQQMKQLQFEAASRGLRLKPGTGQFSGVNLPFLGPVGHTSPAQFEPDPGSPVGRIRELEMELMRARTEGEKSRADLNSATADRTRRYGSVSIDPTEVESLMDRYRPVFEREFSSGTLDDDSYRRLIEDSLTIFRRDNRDGIPTSTEVKQALVNSENMDIVSRETRKAQKAGIGAPIQTEDGEVTTKELVTLDTISREIGLDASISELIEDDRFDDAFKVINAYEEVSDDDPDADLVLLGAGKGLREKISTKLKSNRRLLDALGELPEGQMFGLGNSTTGFPLLKEDIDAHNKEWEDKLTRYVKKLEGLANRLKVRDEVEALAR